MTPREQYSRATTRRQFLGRSTTGIGVMALASLLNEELFAAGRAGPAFAPKAKRVIYLFMSGAPSHIDLFDPKPVLTKRTGEDLPPSVRMGQRITGMTSGQARLQMVGPAHPFVRAGKAGTAITPTLPYTARVIDDIALIRSMHTNPINHDPAVTFLLTGNQQPGRPTVGAWVSYGLGSVNRNLPEYVVMLSGGGGQPLLSRYWGNGFWPGNHQGVQFRSGGDPVLYVNDPP